ncbi:phospholipase D alpha 4-like [Arachis ipaensis]|uniref:phospholipase D alpha 4-like n=1 Tax=Arachis ipaensis TaxID=130454 RepID=UPI000A2B05FF|nr:phospholipase D alpha 4-like [Arachis ipaensis]
MAKDDDEMPKILHGTIEATIFNASSPPSSSSFPFKCLCLKAEKPAYVTIKIDKNKVAKTIEDIDRVWNQTFKIQCAYPIDSTITITLKTKTCTLGKYHIKGQKLLEEGGLINGFIPLLMEDNNGKRPNQQKLKLKFQLWFNSAEELLEPISWAKIMRFGNSCQGMRDSCTTFPQRSNCYVKLYHDAHHCSTFQPNIGLLCEAPRKLWEDVYKAIEGAKHIIYIAAWSLNPNLVLVRDPQTEIPHAKGIKLGDLLKKKAEEGVAVRIMLWDDEKSLPFIKKNKGVITNSNNTQHHDDDDDDDNDDAFAYFKKTRVICTKCPRLHHKFPTLFSHHQKTITLDTKSPNNSSDDDGEDERELMSFLGGLDLCEGRYDTEQHSLFHTLIRESHCYDFYQPNIGGASLNKGGPRTPWHDAHACVIGEAAWDVLTNFDQRWRKQCDSSFLVPTTTIANVLGPRNSTTSNTSIDKDWNWKVQVYRSIDDVSASFQSQSFRELHVERSIHEAYVEAIRSAEKFIYIENEYFIGGCQLWDKDRDSGCTNLIPIEIALKIVSKIKAKERFAVYIVIPMWSEGVPKSEAVQDILHWTRETMTMMYRLIGEALKENGENNNNGHPKDYLNFFCLANREQKGSGEYIPQHAPHPGTLYGSAQSNRRFMVYVHSKFMIVDDEYILIGSANVNQRSMDGERDTEIAIGCYQLSQDNKHEGMRHGEIHAFRMSLWYEHTASSANYDLFLEPQSLECVNIMRSIGDKMWHIYINDEIVDMEGVHLVTYPISVTQDGCVKDLPDGVRFPDTNRPRLLLSRRVTLGLPSPPILLPYIREAGFGHVVEWRNFIFDNFLISAFVERWRLETHMFHLLWGEASITLQDVANHIGLRTAREPVGGCTRDLAMMSGDRHGRHAVSAPVGPQHGDGDQQLSDEDAEYARQEDIPEVDIPNAHAG